MASSAIKDQWRRNLYDDLKDAYGDQYEKSPEEFEKLLDSDEQFVSDVYADLKNAYEVTMTEEAFKKKAYTKVTDPVSGSGSSPTPPSYGSAASLAGEPVMMQGVPYPSRTAEGKDTPQPDMLLNRDVAAFVGKKFPGAVRGINDQAVKSYLGKNGFDDEQAQELIDMAKSKAKQPPTKQQKKEAEYGYVDPEAETQALPDSFKGLSPDEQQFHLQQQGREQYQQEKAKGYSDYRKGVQETAFKEAYEIAKSDAIKQRELQKLSETQLKLQEQTGDSTWSDKAAKTLLTSGSEDTEFMDFDAVTDIVEEIGKKYKLTAPEKTVLHKQIRTSYEQEPSAKKAQVDADLEYKSKFGMTPWQQQQWNEQKHKEVETQVNQLVAETDKELGTLTNNNKRQVGALMGAISEYGEQLLAKYQSAVDTGQMDAEQAQSAFEQEVGVIQKEKEKEIKAIQLRYVNDFAKAKKMSEDRYVSIIAGAAAKGSSMTEDQKAAYKEMYKKHLGEHERLRVKNNDNYLRDKSYFDQGIITLERGLGDLYGAYGGALAMAGLEEGAYKVNMRVQQHDASLGPNYTSMEGLFDPTWWIANGGRSVPMMAVLAPVGMAGGTVTGIAARAFGAAKRYQSLASTLGGGISSWYGETYMEKAMGYNDAISSGLTPEQAADVAADIGKWNLVNLPMQIMEIAPFFHKMKGATAILMGTVSGAAEEMSQNWAQKRAMGNVMGEQYGWKEFMQDPETWVSGMIGAGMSAPFVIGGQLGNANEDSKRRALGKAVRNFVNQGSHAQASAVVQAAFDNDLIDEKTKADFDIAINAMVQSAEQLQTVEDPTTRAGAEQAIVSAALLQDQIDNTPEGPVRDALVAQMQAELGAVQGVVTGTAPIITVNEKGSEGPMVMTPEMMDDFLNNPVMVQAVAEGRIDVEVRNNPEMEQKVIEAVAKHKERQELIDSPDIDSDIPETMDKVKSGELVTYKGEEGTIIKDKETGENIFVSRTGKETIISGGGDASKLSEHGIESRRVGKVKVDGKDYHVVQSGGQEKVMVKNEKGKLIESPLGKAKKAEIIAQAKETPVATEPAVEAAPVVEQEAPPVAESQVEGDKTETSEPTPEPVAEEQIPPPTPTPPPIKPIRQLGTGANVYFETEKYRVNDGKNGKVLLNVGNKNDVVPLANIEFDTAEEAVFVAEQLEKIIPEGLTEGYHNVEKIIENVKAEYAAKQTGSEKTQNSQGDVSKVATPQQPPITKEDGVAESEKVGKVEGAKKERVKFADGLTEQQEVAVETTFALMEADDVQPSHLPDGSRNPEHTISLAQPKERNDVGSKIAQDKIAAKPDLSQVGASPNAYSGAPIVNERGEVIQGNNRTIGLKKHYNQKGVSYKEQLAQNAEKYGLTKEQVIAMKNPILVRVAKVNDAQSVSLGNKDVKDLETGGKQRIDPLVASRKISNKDKSRILSLVFDNENETLNAAIRRNAGALAEILKAYLNPSQINTAWKRSGELTLSGLADIESTINNLIFDGAPVVLPEVFENLSSTVIKGIQKALRYIYAVDSGDSLLPDLQNAVLAIGKYMSSGFDNFPLWIKQYDIETGISPNDTFTETELALAGRIIHASKQVEISNIFKEYAELINGTPATLLDEAVAGVSRKEAIKQLFKINEDAVQKQSPKGVDVRQPSGNGEGVGQGNSQDKNAPAKDTEGGQSPPQSPEEKQVDDVADKEPEVPSKKEKYDQSKDAVKKAWEEFKKTNNSGNLGIRGFDPEQEARKLYELHEALVNMATAAISYGITTFKAWVKDSGLRGTRFMERAWEDAIGRAIGEPPLIGSWEEMLNKETDNVTQTLEKQRSEYKALRKSFWQRFSTFLSRSFLDTNFKLRRFLQKNGGTDAFLMKINASGATMAAEEFFNNKVSDIFGGLNTKQEELLNDIIQLQRTITIDEEYDRRRQQEENDLVAQYVMKNGVSPVGPDLDAIKEEAKKKHKRIMHPGDISKESAAIKIESLRESDPEGFANLEKRADAFFDAMRELLKKRLDNGQISQQSYDSMVLLDYAKRVFLERLFDNIESPRKQLGTTSVNDIHALEEGSVMELFNNARYLLKTTATSTYNAILQNKANKELYNFAKNINPTNGVIVVDDPIGVNSNGEPNFKAMPVGWYRIIHYDNGVPKAVLMKNDMAQEWVGLPPVMKNTAANVFRLFSGSAILREMATGVGNLVFWMTNLPRDIVFINLFTNTYSNIVPIALAQQAKDMLKVSLDVFSRGLMPNSQYKKAIEQGLLMNFLTHQGNPIAHESLKDNKFIRGWNNAHAIVGYLTLSFEIIPRMAIRARSIKEGMRKAERNIGRKLDPTNSGDKIIIDRIEELATAKARDYIDFAQGGQLTKTIDNIVPYANAATLAFRNAATYTIDNPGAFGIKAAQWGAMTAALAAYTLKNYDDEYEKDITDDEKARYFIFMLPLTTMDPNTRITKRKYIRVAKNQELAPIAAVSEELVNYHMNEQINWKKIGRAFDVAMPSYIQMDLQKGKRPPETLLFSVFQNIWYGVPMVSAMSAVFANYDTFTKEKIYRGNERVSNYLKYEPFKTQKYFRKVGEKYDLPPEQLKRGVGKLLTDVDKNLFTSLLLTSFDAITEKMSPEEKQEFNDAAVTNMDKAFDALTKRVLSETNPGVNNKSYDLISDELQQQSDERLIKSRKIKEGAKQFVDEDGKVDILNMYIRSVRDAQTAMQEIITYKGNLSKMYKAIGQLGVENGKRSQVIVEMLNTMETIEEQEKFLTELSLSGVLTEHVFNQVRNNYNMNKIIEYQKNKKKVSNVGDADNE